MSFLKAADLSRQQLLQLVEHLQRSAKAQQLRCWIEGPDGWALDWWPGTEGELRWCGAGRKPVCLPSSQAVLDSASGRLFAPQGELRWRHLPSLGEQDRRCVFLGEQDWVGDCLEDCTQELQGLSFQKKHYLLWGQQTKASPGEWIELRIPHRFRYPLQGAPRGVMIEVELWRDRLGQLQFVRLCDLKPFEEIP